MAEQQTARKRTGGSQDTASWIAHRQAEVRRRAVSSPAPTAPTVKRIRRLDAKQNAGAPVRGPSQPSPGWLESGFVARRLGNVAGIGRGALHTAEAAGSAVGLANELLHPYDPANWPGLLDAASGVAHAAAGSASYAKRAVKTPKIVGDDITHQMHLAHVALDPNASPKALTPGEEFKRNFNIGQNQGEVGFNFVTAVAGGPIAEELVGFNAARTATSAAQFEAMGFTTKEAARLAETYKGMGSHWIARRWLKHPLLAWFKDSPYNVLEPKGINKGDFYALHYAVDSKMHGARMFKGQRGWSGARLGLEKHGVVGRAIRGAPTRVKGTVAGAVLPSAVATAGNAANRKNTR